MQASRNPQIQKSLKIQKSKTFYIYGILHFFGILDFWNFGFFDFWIFGFFGFSLIFGFSDFWIFRCLDFWVFGFWDFWIFCVLHLCFQSVATAPKLDSEKNGVCIGIYSVFKGCACRGGGDHIFLYMYIFPDS